MRFNYCWPQISIITPSDDTQTLMMHVQPNGSSFACNMSIEKETVSEFKNNGRIIDSRPKMKTSPDANAASAVLAARTTTTTAGPATKSSAGLLLFTVDHHTNHTVSVNNLFL